MTNFSKVDNTNMKISHEIYQSLENGFINSRTALKKLLQNENLVVNDLKSDLTLVNHRELPHFPQFLTSLSHTKEIGAAVLVNRLLVMGIGIDVEWGDREIKAGAEKFFINKQDQHQLSPIELWTAKEAAFKALSPLGTFPGTLVLSKIIIRGNQFYTAEEPQLIGNFTVFRRSANQQRELVYTIATLS